jgi:predicted RNA-binding Zn-ribbon protein involved in translation (DUF1610 family)
MAQYELFELTGILFDPCENAPQKVKDAIDKKIKNLGSDLGRETQQPKKDRINGELSFLKQCLGEGDSADSIFDGGKLNARYAKLAETKTKLEIEKFKAVVALKKRASRIITNGNVNTECNKTHLSKGHVEQIYIEAGFTISTIDPLAAYPKFISKYNKLVYEPLADLRKANDPNPQSKDVTLCVDMYAFAAYLCKEPKNAAEYRNKPTTELYSLCDQFSIELSQRNDDFGKLLARSAAAGKTVVFKSDDTRKEYDDFLKYKSPLLQELFEQMKGLSNTEKVDPKIADECIKKIAEVFGDNKIALAIYNTEAKLKEEPYVPTVRVKCSHCQSLSEFTDANEAQTANKCSHCGKALYKACDKCKKPVLAYLDKCPECGFVFASTDRIHPVPVTQRQTAAPLPTTTRRPMEAGTDRKERQTTAPLPTTTRRPMGAGSDRKERQTAAPLHPIIRMWRKLVGAVDTAMPFIILCLFVFVFIVGIVELVKLPASDSPESTTASTVASTTTSVPILKRFESNNGYFYAYSNSLSDGYGEYYWTNGNIYKGNWENGKRAGEGEYIAEDFTYKGSFADNQFNGLGQYTTEDFTYLGNFADNLFEGYGEIYWTIGNTYIGNWENGKRVGLGQYTTEVFTYKGNFADNRFDGYGEMFWANGEIYKGNYVDNKRDGYGEYYWTNGNIYKGNWENGERVGEGEYFVDDNTDTGGN